MEGLEPPTHAVLETTALPVELHPYGAAGGSRTRVDGFADRCLTTRPQPLEEPLTGLEPALSVWKTDVQTCYTSTAVKRWCAVRVSIPRPQIKSLVLSQLS